MPQQIECAYYMMTFFAFQGDSSETFKISEIVNHQTEIRRWTDYCFLMERENVAIRQEL